METILALDFDGVICDSLPECYFSSFLTVHNDVPSSIPLQDIENRSPRYVQFCRWRPFVRSGEDYVLIQNVMDREKVPEGQRNMDRLIDQTGREAMAEYKRQLYDVRENLLAHHKDLWLSLNPVFPFLRPYLPKLAENKNVWILSTKKPAFIAQILSAAGVSWSESRILEASGERKIEVMDRHWGSEASVAFLDDQPDHFQGLPVRIRCLLPVWGYILTDWLTQVPEVLEARNVEDFLTPWL